MHQCSNPTLKAAKHALSALLPCWGIEEGNVFCFAYFPSMRRKGRSSCWPWPPETKYAREATEAEEEAVAASTPASKAPI